MNGQLDITEWLKTVITNAIKSYKPALNMLVMEQQLCSWSWEKLEATLSIMNASHA